MLQITELHSCHCVVCFRTTRNDPEGNSEMVKAVSLVSKQRGWGQGVDCYQQARQQPLQRHGDKVPWALGAGPPEPLWYDPHLTESCGWDPGQGEEEKRKEKKQEKKGKKIVRKESGFLKLMSFQKYEYNQVCWRENLSFVFLRKSLAPIVL